MVVGLISRRAVVSAQGADKCAEKILARRNSHSDGRELLLTVVGGHSTLSAARSRQIGIDRSCHRPLPIWRLFQPRAGGPKLRNANALLPRRHDGSKPPPSIAFCQYTYSSSTLGIAEAEIQSWSEHCRTMTVRMPAARLFELGDVDEVIYVEGGGRYWLP